MRLQSYAFGAHLCMFFGPLKFCSFSLIYCLQRWEYSGWSKNNITQVSSSSSFKWTPLPHICALLVSIFFLCLCVHNLVFYVCLHIFLGLWSFAPLLLFPICKGGNVVVKIGMPSSKLLQAWTLSEHFHPLSMFFLCPCFSRVYVCNLVFLYAPSHFFGHFSFFPIYKGGGAMVKVGMSLPKFFQTQTSSEYLRPLFVFFLCPHFFHVCVMCFYVHLHMFSSFWNFLPFF
jgi:hypothetical protein